MAAPPVTLPAALNTWARGSALAARDIEHVHDRHLCLDARGLAPLRPLHLARYNRVELVVPFASVLDGFDIRGRTVDLRQGDHHARALLLQVDLLWITPIDATCIRLDLVPEHGFLSHVVERTDSDVGGGVVLTHDRLEVPHCEEKFFDGATPLESVPVLRQCRKISPYLGEHTVDVKLDLVEVQQALGVFRYRVLVVHREAVSLRDHPDGGGGRVVQLGLTRCLGAGGRLLEGCGGGRRLGFTLGRCHGVFVRVRVVDVCGGGLVVRVTFVDVQINDEDKGDGKDDGEEGDKCGGRLDTQMN